MAFFKILRAVFEERPPFHCRKFIPGTVFLVFAILKQKVLPDFTVSAVLRAGPVEAPGKMRLGDNQLQPGINGFVLLIADLLAFPGSFVF